MSNRYLSWTLLIAACGLQACLVIKGCILFLNLDAVILPLWLKGFSSYLFSRYLLLPYYYPIFIIGFLALTTFASWLFLGLKKSFGWSLSLVLDLCVAIPSLALISALWYRHAKLQGNPENLLLVLSVLHILTLSSQPIRTLIFRRPGPLDHNDGLTAFITPAGK